MKNRIFIIAEAGINHNGSIKNALKLVKIAKDCGADAVKFQLFDKFEQISRNAPTSPYQNKNTKKKYMLEMANNYDLDWKYHVKIKKYSEKLKIEYIASVFDKKSTDFYLKKIKAKIIKIASSEIDNYQLLKYINLKAKKVILSTGMASVSEIDKAVNLLKKIKNISILQCTSCYPTKHSDVNLSFMNFLKNKYSKYVGLSDHTLDDVSSIAAVGMGAKIIEKHFTINRKFKGPDHSISLNPKDLKKFIKNIRIAEQIIGSEKNKPTFTEKKLIKYSRRGLVAACEIKKGKILRKKNINFKRPAFNFMIKDIKKIIGRKLIRNIKIDEVFTNKHFNK